MSQQVFIDQTEAALLEVLNTLRANFSKQSADALKSRASLDQWNALECFAHLNLELGDYLPEVELAIHKAKARRWITPAATVRYTLAGRRSIRRADPANGRAYKTARRNNFLHQPIGVEELKTLLIQTEKLLRAVRIARETDVNRPVIRKRGSWFGRYTLGNMLEYLTAHIARHVAQAGLAGEKHPA
jgi:DinB superfamily